MNRRLIAGKRSCIRSLIIAVLVLAGLFTGNRLTASVNNEVYENTVIQRPSHIPNEEAWEEYKKKQRQTIAAGKKRGNVSNWERQQCVFYAKTLVGVYGTWGNGGRNLSANSGPVVGAVIIFRGTHVGVITAVDGHVITYTDRNYDYSGTIRHNVKIPIGHGSIWKYHTF